MSSKIESEEKSRIAARKAELGEQKLKELEEALQKSKAESDTPPPPEMIAQFPITDVSLQSYCSDLQPASLTWVPVETAINNIPGQRVKSDQDALQRHLDTGDPLPFQAHFAHVKVGRSDQALLKAVQLRQRQRPFRYRQTPLPSHAVSYSRLPR